MNLTYLLCYLSSQGITKAHLWIKKKERVRERLSLKRASIICIARAEGRKARFKKSEESVRALQQPLLAGSAWHCRGLPLSEDPGWDLFPKTPVNPSSWKDCWKVVGPGGKPLINWLHPKNRKSCSMHSLSEHTDNGFYKCSFLSRKHQIFLLLSLNVCKTFW